MRTDWSIAHPLGRIELVPRRELTREDERDVVSPGLARFYVDSWASARLRKTRGELVAAIASGELVALRRPVVRAVVETPAAPPLGPDQSISIPPPGFAGSASTRAEEAWSRDVDVAAQARALREAAALRASFCEKCGMRPC